MPTLKQRIRNLHAADILDETLIVSILDIPHLAYRKYNPKPNTIALPLSCKYEIRNGEFDKSVNLAALYHTSPSQIHYALYSKLPPLTPPPSPNNILAFMQEHDNIEAMRRHFRLSARASTLLLQHIGWKEVFTPLDKTRMTELIESRDYSYKTIAQMLGCHVQSVVKHAASIGHRRQEQNTAPWPEIIAYARKNSITSAATLYDVSRSAIYYHMGKDI